MPLVLVDSNVALPAILGGPNAFARKLFVLFGVGAAMLRAEQLELELETLRAEESGSEGSSSGSFDSILERANGIRGVIEDRFDHLPHDWFMAGSAHLFDEYERKAMELAGAFGRPMSPEMARKVARQIQALSIGAPTPHYVAAPVLTADPEDDPIVHDALRFDVDFILARDTGIVPDKRSAFFRHGEMATTAYWFDYFISENPFEIEWDDIDGTRLKELLAVFHANRS